MIVEFSNIRISPKVMQCGGSSLTKEIIRAVGLNEQQVSSVELKKRSIDARKKSNVFYVVTATVDIPSVRDISELSPARYSYISAKPYIPLEPVVIPDCSGYAISDNLCPVIIGAGPAGLFCALYLARAGLGPILIERGEAVDDRARTIDTFISTGKLNPNSNIQFGEGGAGTYSDGKLNTGTKSSFARFILEEFVRAGAPESILVDAKPHVGTDYLSEVVSNLRKSILEAGGDVRFNTLMERINLTSSDNGMRSVKSVRLRNLCTGKEDELECKTLILALGHSARDTYCMLKDIGVHLERKQFAVGVRIEHPQSLINHSQYGKFASQLPSADYKLSMHTQKGRGVYTFCMCPGGEVVASASEEGGVCVNGMSRYARDGSQANSALLVEVCPDDFAGNDVLAGMYFQRELERRSYELARDASPYAAPAQRVGDFIKKSSVASSSECAPKKSNGVHPTYPRGIKLVDLDAVLPDFVADSMREALPVFDRRLKGFADPDALLTAVEARSSAPIRILRDSDTYQSVNVCGMYPVGEGAGYAGGIMSAASDGLKIAKRIVDETLACGGVSDAE